MCEFAGELTVILINVWWVQNLRKYWHSVNKQRRSLLFSDTTISRSYVIWKLGNGFKLKSQTILMFWGNFDDIGYTSRTLQNIRKNFRIPASYCPIQYERFSSNRSLMKNVQHL